MTRCEDLRVLAGASGSTGQTGASGQTGHTGGLRIPFICKGVLSFVTLKVYKRVNWPLAQRMVVTVPAGASGSTGQTGATGQTGVTGMCNCVSNASGYVLCHPLDMCAFAGQLLWC